MEVAVVAAVDGSGVAARVDLFELADCRQLATQVTRLSAGETLAGDLQPDRRATPWPPARPEGRER